MTTPEKHKQSSRITLARHIFGKWWSLMYGGVWGLYASADLCIQKWGAEATRKWWDQLVVPHKLGWKGALIILLSTALLALFEHSHRRLRDQENEIAKLLLEKNRKQPTDSWLELSREKRKLEDELASLRAKMPMIRVIPALMLGRDEAGLLAEKIELKRKAIEEISELMKAFKLVGGD